jgi:hypothetical protein
MSSEKKEYTYPKNHVGYISKSKAGNSMITVEQDLVLKKGDKLIIKKPVDSLKSLLDNGLIDEAKFEERAAKIPDWKLSEITKMEFKD